MNNPTCRAELLALAERLGYPLLSLKVLSYDTDPFLCGAKEQARLAEWFATLFVAYPMPGTFHVRRLHYRLVSADPVPLMLSGKPYQNTMQCYNVLSNASWWARHLGLVDPAGFVDRRNPRPCLLYTSPSPRDS